MKAPSSLLRLFRTRLASSLWLIPSLCAVGAVILSFLFVSIDRRVSAGFSGGGLVFSAGAEGARGVLGTIAGSIITVTGVVFSMTIVALQLASTQYTPRVLRSFTEDRATHVVLGIFIGTFTYSLLVLRTVRSEFDDLSRFVPAISVTFAVALALISIGALIFFVNHIARSIRVENVIERISNDTIGRIDHLYPEEIGSGRGARSAGEQNLPQESREPTRTIRAPSSGYLQHISEDGIVELAESQDVRIEMLVKVGDFLVKDDPIANVSPAAGTDKPQEHLRLLFKIGAERTLDQDLSRGLIEITDVALRALSPGINDPTTAMAAIDRLVQILSVLGGREFPDRARIGESGKIRFVAVTTSFDTFLHQPFAQLRDSGGGTPAVAIHLASALRRIGRRVLPERRAAVLRELDELLTTARRKIQDTSELSRLEEHATAARLELVPGL